MYIDDEIQELMVNLIDKAKMQGHKAGHEAGMNYAKYKFKLKFEEIFQKFEDFKAQIPTPTTEEQEIFVDKLLNEL